MTDPTVAVDAIRMVDEERYKQYGDPKKNLKRIADMWSGYLEHPVTPEDVAMMMVMVKISRSKSRYSRDNAVDGVAYLLIHDAMARYEHGK